MSRSCKVKLGSGRRSMGLDQDATAGSPIHHGQARALWRGCSTKADSGSLSLLACICIKLISLSYLFRSYMRLSSSTTLSPFRPCDWNQPRSSLLEPLSNEHVQDAATFVTWAFSVPMYPVLYRQSLSSYLVLRCRGYHVLLYCPLAPRTCQNAVDVLLCMVSA